MWRNCRSLVRRLSMLFHFIDWAQSRKCGDTQKGGIKQTSGHDCVFQRHAINKTGSQTNSNDNVYTQARAWRVGWVLAGTKVGDEWRNTVRRELDTVQRFRRYDIFSQNYRD